MTKHIPIRSYSELKRENIIHPMFSSQNVFVNDSGNVQAGLIEWIDNNGINTPYLVTTINTNRGAE